MDWIIKPLAAVPMWAGCLAGLVIAGILAVVIARYVLGRRRRVFVGNYEVVQDDEAAIDPKMDPARIQVGTRFRYQAGGEVCKVVGIVVLDNGQVSWAHYFARSESDDNSEVRRFSFGNNTVVPWEELTTNLEFDSSGAQYGGKTYKRHESERGSVQFESRGKTWKGNHGRSGWVTYRMYVGPDGSGEWLMYERFGSSNWKVYYGCDVPATHFELV